MNKLWRMMVLGAMLAPVGLRAEMAVNIKPFNFVDSEITDEASAIEWLGSNSDYKNLVDLKDRDLHF